MSSIKVCFIPPKGLESHMRHGSMVMSLAQLSYAHDDSSFDYVRTVQDLRTKKKFVIMDNGANEGQQLTNEDLEQRAAYLFADELVLPDVLRESEATYAASMKFLHNRTKQLPSYMGVVQGRIMSELQALIELYADEPLVTTLGLPRLLVAKAQSIRIDLANWIEQVFPNRFAIHLLGASSKWIREPYYAAKYASHIRSIDTSLPYNYGFEGICIDSTTEQIDRHENYFTRHHSMTTLTAVAHNEEVYKEWCNGILSRTVTSVR